MYVTNLLDSMIAFGSGHDSSWYSPSKDSAKGNIVLYSMQAAYIFLRIKTWCAIYIYIYIHVDVILYIYIDREITPLLSSGVMDTRPPCIHLSTWDSSPKHKELVNHHDHIYIYIYIYIYNIVLLGYNWKRSIWHNIYIYIT